MEPPASAPGPPLAESPCRLLHGGTRDDGAGARAPGPDARRAMVDRAHGAAPAAHGRGRAAVVDGCARGATAGRWASGATARCAGAHEQSDGSNSDALDSASQRGLDRVRARLVGLARTGALRSRPRFAPLAPRRARVFPWQRAAVLATGDPRLAGADGLAALDDDSVPR